MNLAPAFNPEWVVMECGECGVHFCVTGPFHRERRERKLAWHCPNGHQRVYGETDAERLKRELAAKEQELAREREQVARRDRALAASRGQLTKIKNRIQNGVCPCCRRSFQNLMRHMSTQHPDWKEQGIKLLGPAE